MRIINRVTKTFGLLYFLCLVAGLTVLSFSQNSIPLNDHNYTTNFPLAENPISESGNWVNGGTIGIDWTNVSTASGVAIGHQVGVSYSDATALLTGEWASDQAAKAVVYSIK